MKKLLGIVLASALVIFFLPEDLAFATNSFSSLSLDKSVVNAGGNVSLAFTVTLDAEPQTPYSFTAYITATSDENGDGWTSQQWSAPATLVSGSQTSGRWIATIPIGSNAYTGNFEVGIATPDKTFSRTSPLPLFINGTTMPVPLYTVTGTMTNISTSSTTLTAGQSYEFTFDVALTSTPSSDFGFAGYIWGIPDENGDPWVQDQWSNKASLVSGNLVKGTWKVTISIPSSSITGDYLFSPAQGVSKFITSSGSLQLHINGVAPTPPIVPFYRFSNQVLTAGSVVRGNVATATFHLSSNDAQLQVPECIIDGGAISWVRATLISGTSLEGNWSCGVTVPSDITPATYDFHIVAIGYANKNKNEERVILPIKVAGNESDLYSNTAFLTTTSASSTSPLSGDSIGGSLPHQASTSPVGRFYIPPGVGNVIFSVNGPGLVSAGSFASAGRQLILNRNTSSGINAYLFADGLQGRSTISISVSGTPISKVVNFGNFGSPSPSPTPSSSSSLSPTATPSATRSSNDERATPSPVVSITPSPKPSVTPKPTSSLSPTPISTLSPSVSSSAVASTSPNPELMKAFQVTQSAIKNAISKYPAIRRKLQALFESLPIPPNMNEDSNAWRSKNKSIGVALNKLIAGQKVTTIYCSKGSIERTVTGVNPGCPSGYRKS